MTTRQFAVLGAALGALIVGVWILAYNPTVEDSTDVIRGNLVALLMLAGAVFGFFVAYAFGPTPFERDDDHKSD